MMMSSTSARRWAGHPPVSVKVADVNTGEPLRSGEHGELCCRGYNVMKGYYKMPEETAKAIDKNGFLHSGDMGTIDEEGYFRVTGRIKDMIIRGGENIYPLEVENFLLTMPGVLDAQVVGCPDEKYGEVVTAFIPHARGLRGHDAGGRARLRHPAHRPLQGAQARLLRGRFPHEPGQ